MKHLGRIHGTGTLRSDNEAVALVDYDFDGFLVRGAVTGSGEIRMPSDTLRKVFGRADLRLLTDDGRLLSLHFSERCLAEASDAAHVDVTGALPSRLEWRT